MRNEYVRRLALSVILSLSLSAAERFTIQDIPGDRVEVRENGKPVLVYNFGVQANDEAPSDRKRCCYIYPAYTPGGVNPLDDFPKDHFHHRGLFWAWQDIQVHGETYDQWTLKGAEHKFERWLEQEVGDQQAALTVENSWWAGGKKIAIERVHILIKPAMEESREFGVTLTITALKDAVTIRGSQDQRKGYGGFSARFGPRTGTLIRTSEGVLKGDEDHGEHMWSELEAVYEKKRAILRITPDPTNPGTPHEWCLRQYGFVGANFPGVRGFVLEPGSPLTLKYRVSLRDHSQSK